MQELFHIIVDGLPESVNRVWRCKKGSSKPFLSKKARTWKESARLAMVNCWNDLSNEGSEREPIPFNPPIECRVVMAVLLSRHNKVKYDLDNRMKLIQDALQDAGIIKNDNQVYMIISGKHDSCEDTTEIRLYALDDQRVMDVFDSLCDVVEKR